MRRVVLGLVICIFLAGCEQLRFAPSELQKRNAWLHSRTTAITADTARTEDTSAKLQALARLSDRQARAITAYYGMPREFPQADTAEEILAQANVDLAGQALVDASQRPDAWRLADSAMELGIAICALLGGVYGTLSLIHI